MPKPWEKTYPSPDGGKPWKKTYDPPEESSWQLAGEEALGVAKGLGKGAASLVTQIPGLGTPSVNELNPDIKKWEDEPSTTWGETAGKFAGQTLPFAVVPEIGGASTLRALAGRALAGGLSGAAQPTKPGESRLTNVLTGAATAGVISPKVTGGAARLGATVGQAGLVEELARGMGVSPSLLMLALAGGGWHGLHALYRNALSKWAQKAGATVGKFPAGAGAVGGQAAERVQENQGGQ